MAHVLASVNHSFCKNTGEATFATLFFVDYDDARRTLRYANCGHLPPLLLGANATAEERGRCRVERLDATCTVVGLFKGWECEIAEVALIPGDTLVLYTDGITEAAAPTAKNSANPVCSTPCVPTAISPSALSSKKW